jgi:cysteine desulfurase
MAEGRPGSFQPCLDRLLRKWEVGDELFVAPGGSVRRLPGRFLQVAGREPRIQAVQQRAVVYQCSAPSSLGVSRNLPPAQHEVRLPGDRQAGDTQCGHDPLENELKARGDIGQLRPRIEGQDHRVAQAAGRENDRAPAGETPQHANAVRAARLLDHVVGDTPIPADNDDGPDSLPASGEGAGSAGFNGLKHRPFPRQVLFRFGTALLDAVVRHRFSCMMVSAMVVYLDCAATTPLDPRVRVEMMRYLDEDFGNAGSRTHELGRRARTAVEHARDRVAAVVGSARGDVIFTSGATESNNLAILGLAAAADRRHIVSTAIEHHAVLEPLAELGRRGFDVTLIPPGEGGAVDPDAILAALRPDTLLVSMMHVNNETGVIQPVTEVADRIHGTQTYLHVDAAQSFAREMDALRHARVDLISVSAHKINGPKGVGALVMRRRDGRRPPLQPLMFGGGQERQLRPGTMPVPLIVGLGLAAELAVAEADARDVRCRALRQALLAGLAPLEPVVNGDPSRSVPYILNLSCPGLDAETAIDAWSHLVAISNGAACTSQHYTCSHVLSGMQLPAWRKDGALRFSWCAASPEPDWSALVAAVEPYRGVERAGVT